MLGSYARHVRSELEIAGLPLSQLRGMAADDLDGLMAFGRPISFDLGSASILAEFNRSGEVLLVNLAHIDGGGEGVLVVLWTLIRRYAAERVYAAIRWNIHAATCANPNPRLQKFLRRREFIEIEDPLYGRIFTRTLSL